MRKMLLVMMVASLLCLLGVAARACPCGKTHYRCCQPSCCAQTPAPCCQEEVAYEEKQITCYKTVYKEIKEKVVVDAVKYVEDTEYRDVCCTVCEPCPPNPCEKVDTCAPCTCAPTRQVQCLRKVPVTVYRPVPYQKVVERPHVVIEQVPYTITCRIPKPVCRVPACAPAAPCR
jgi:hypothetical protein